MGENETKSQHSHVSVGIKIPDKVEYKKLLLIMTSDVNL